VCVAECTNEKKLEFSHTMASWRRCRKQASKQASVMREGGTTLYEISARRASYYSLKIDLTLTSEKSQEERKRLRKLRNLLWLVIYIYIADMMLTKCTIKA
jgi:hypothetical protein